MQVAKNSVCLCVTYKQVHNFFAVSKMLRESKTLIEAASLVTVTECCSQYSKSGAEQLGKLASMLQIEQSPGEILPAFKNYALDIPVIYGEFGDISLLSPAKCIVANTLFLLEFFCFLSLRILDL